MINQPLVTHIAHRSSLVPFPLPHSELEAAEDSVSSLRLCHTDDWPVQSTKVTL